MACVAAYPHLKTGPGDAQIEMNRSSSSPGEFVGKSLLKKTVLAGGQQPLARPGRFLSTELPNSQVSAKLLQGQPHPPEEGSTRRGKSQTIVNPPGVSLQHQLPSRKSPVCSACRAV